MCYHVFNVRFSLFWPKITVHFRGKKNTFLTFMFDKIFSAETTMNENIKKHHPKRIWYFKWQKFSAGWPKTSSNFKFCFLKVARRMTYIQWFWLHACKLSWEIVELNLELYVMKYWIRVNISWSNFENIVSKYCKFLWICRSSQSSE